MGTKSYYTSTKLGLGGCTIGILLSFLLALPRLIILLIAMALRAILKPIRRGSSGSPTEDNKA